MAAKHTRGPWMVRQEWVHEDNGEHDIGVDTGFPPGPNGGARSICTMTGCALTGKKRPKAERTRALEANRANAQLIAAAPTLLAACELAEPYLSKMMAEGIRTGVPPERARTVIRAAIAAAKGTQ